MSLAPGSRLGPVEIVAPIGAGGMAEVRREVEITVLPSSFSQDAGPAFRGWNRCSR